MPGDASQPPPIPTIVIRPAPRRAGPIADDPLAALVAWAGEQRRSPDAAAADLLQGLIAEGRRFARTPSGRRWRSLLADSAIARNGWLLWSMLGLDRLAAHPTGPADAADSSADTPADTPADWLEDLLRTVGTSRIESLLRELSEQAIMQDRPEDADALA